MDFRSQLLLQAVTSRDDGAVKVLLSEGADVNARNSSGQTPLILAIVSGQEHLLKLLLEAGADALLRDHTQLNAVDWAERKGRSDLAQILRTTQLHGSSTNDLKEKLFETEKSSPFLGDQRNRSVPSDEKSRKWLAGIKRRLDEEADREATKDRSANTIKPDRPTLIPDDVTPETTKAPPSAVDAIVEAAPQTIPERLPSTPGVLLPSTQLSKPSRGSKRCPKCNTIYNNELLAYCAYHVVPLVDADEPIVIAKVNSSMPLLWILVLITLGLAGIVGVFISDSLYGNKDRPGSSTPAPTPNRQGKPVLGSTLVGKSIYLPAAEITAQSPQQSATITVRVKINQEGRVVMASSSEGDALFREAAIEAAKRSTFSVEKAKRRGAEGTITYTFSQ